MSEPLIDRLSRFTPDAGGLDRDTLLFAAGRASARPNRVWITLAAALAASQALTLALWWSRPAPSIAPSPTPLPVSPSPHESPTLDMAGSSNLWTARHKLLEGEPEAIPVSAESGTLVESAPPLRAFGAPPPSALY